MLNNTEITTATTTSAEIKEKVTIVIRGLAMPPILEYEIDKDGSKIYHYECGYYTNKGTI